MNIDYINKITSDIIGSAIEVHKVLGPGLLESAYKECLKYLLIKKGYKVDSEVPVPIVFHEVKLDCGYRIDLLVENEVIVEIKSIEALAPVHTAQVLTHLKFAKKKVGLLINFNVTVLKQGIKRYVL
ncbi:MAG: GxxExxY protein [Ignavibacteria bacterium]|jgi:GxxExxY protein|nr:GxxExxY protein [Ignavibacteria bacterium]MDP3830210.1 GxxExxY protein [Ignavibacteriaceae bacterium]